ncbi:MAG TPA: PAS domain S-box protein [Gemmatimonadaceae bacterium]|nr:PAS domain S-box protein [Gemmatimonadaceae bacterium]
MPTHPPTTVARRPGGALPSAAALAATSATQALRASEQRFRLLVEHTSDAVVILAPDGTVLELNARACALLGVTSSELAGAPGADGEATEPEPLRLAGPWAEAAGLAEGVVLRKDGSARAVEIRSVRLEDGRTLAILRDHTQRRRQEEALHESRASFGGAFDHAPIGMALVAPDGRWLEVNGALCAILGYDAWELQRLRIQDLTHPADLTPSLAAIEALLAGRTDSCQLEKRYLRSDGSVVWTLLSASVVRRADGTASYLITQIQDITERRRAEQALRRQALVVGVLHDAVVVIDYVGRITEWNPAATHVFGHSRSAVLGRSVAFLLADGREAARTIARELRRAGRWGGELAFRGADGQTGLCEVTVAALGEGDARQQAYVVVARDVTQRRAAEQALRASEERARALIEHARDIVAVLAADGTLLYQSPAVERVLGYRPGEMVGWSVDDLVHPDDIPVVQAGLDEILRDPGRVVTMEYRCQGRDGGWRNLEGRAWNLVAHEAVGGIVMHTRDVTEARRLEAQLRQAQKLEAIGQLAAGIAHEINTPTQYVGDNVRFLDSAFADVLALVRRYEAARDQLAGHPALATLAAELAAAEREADLAYLTSEIPSALAQSREGLERIAEIVRSVKAFSHPGGNTMTPVELNREVENTVAVSRNEWKYDAEVVLYLAPDLPAVCCLAGEVSQVLLNLIVNAAHAIADRRRAAGAEGAEVKGTITIATRLVDDHAEIRIADTGTGIPAHVRERIFDPFFTTKEVGRGTGQGLAIARAVIVEKHHGSLTFETEVGVGTTFVIRLPLCGPRAAAPEAATSEAATSEAVVPEAAVPEAVA